MSKTRSLPLDLSHIFIINSWSGIIDAQESAPGNRFSSKILWERGEHVHHCSSLQNMSHSLFSVILQLFSLAWGKTEIKFFSNKAWKHLSLWASYSPSRSPWVSYVCKYILYFGFAYVLCLFNPLPIHTMCVNIMLDFSYTVMCNVQPMEDFIKGKQNPA